MADTTIMFPGAPDAHGNKSDVPVTVRDRALRVDGNTDIQANGEALLTPNKIVDVSTVAIGSIATVWTPAAGKKFRLMGGYISVSAACSVLFEDNVAGVTVFRTPKLAADTPFAFDLANGVLSLAANRVLKATASTGTVTVVGTLYGIEE